jgi:hypothetical protein
MERNLKKYFMASHQVWIAMLAICVLAIVGTDSFVYGILYALVGCVAVVLLSKMSVRHYVMAVPILFVVECVLLVINMVAPDSVWLKLCSVKCHPYYILGIVFVSTSAMIMNIRNLSIRYKVIALVMTNLLLIGFAVGQDTRQDSMMFPVGTLACSYRALQEMFGNYILIIPNAIFCLGVYQTYKILRISSNLFLRLLGIGLSLVVVTESLCDTSSVLSNTSTIGSPYLILSVELGIVLSCIKANTFSIAKKE